VKKAAGLIKRYRFALIFLFVDVLLIIFFPQTGRSALRISADNALEMLSIVPPIFILLGLLDTWVDRQTVMKHMGDQSGERAS
jgi:hypothetical protein